MTKSKNPENGVFLVNKFNHFTPNGVCIDPNPVKLTKEILNCMSIGGTIPLESIVLRALMRLDGFRSEISISVDHGNGRLLAGAVWGSISFGGQELVRFCNEGLYMVSQWPSIYNYQSSDINAWGIEDWYCFFAKRISLAISFGNKTTSLERQNAESQLMLLSKASMALVQIDKKSD